MHLMMPLAPIWRLSNVSTSPRERSASHFQRNKLPICLAWTDPVCPKIWSGKTFGENSETEGVSKRCIQQLIYPALLAPDIIRDVRDGKQPVGLTSDWLMRHAFSPIWKEQRMRLPALERPQLRLRYQNTSKHTGNYGRNRELSMYSNL